MFATIASIYMEAESAHGVEGPILVILAKDETKVKSCISWEACCGGLVGFCGPKEDHVCVSLFEPKLGNVQSRYEAIVDSFK